MKKHTAEHGRVVNLGIYYGCTLWWLCRVYGDERVIGIDTFNWEYVGHWKGQGVPNVEKVQRLVHPHKPQIIKGSSLNPPKWIDDVGFLFIDTCHTGKHLMLEMEAWEPRLRSDAIVMLHDYQRFSEHGYPQAIQKLFSGWKKIGAAHQIIGFTR